MSKNTVAISGLMVRTLDRNVIVELEIAGKWVEVFNEVVVGGGDNCDKAAIISHILETAYIERLVKP